MRDWGLTESIEERLADMMFFVLIAVVGSYPVLASRASRRGLGRLWSAAGAAFGIVLTVMTLQGLYHSVPSLSRLVLYMTALFGPTLLVPTAMLSFSIDPESEFPHLPRAVFGTLVGFACGWLIVVYGPRVW